jgi:hypothetical protein
MALPVGALAGAAGQLKGALAVPGLASGGGIMPQGMAMAPGLGLTAVPAAAPSLNIGAPAQAPTIAPQANYAPPAHLGNSTGGASGTSGGNYGSSGSSVPSAAPTVGAAQGAAGSAVGGADSSGGTTQIAQGSLNINPFSGVYNEGTGGANAGAGANPPARRFLNGPEESPGQNPDYDRIAAPPQSQLTVDMSPVGGFPYSAPGFLDRGTGYAAASPAPQPQFKMPTMTAAPTENFNPPTPGAEGTYTGGTFPMPGVEAAVNPTAPAPSAEASSPGTYHIPGFLERGSTALYDPLTSIHSQPVVPFTGNMPQPRPPPSGIVGAGFEQGETVGTGYSPYAPPAIPEPRPAGEPFYGNMPQPRPNKGQIAGYAPRVPVGTGYNPFGAPPGLPRPRPEIGINPFGIGHR